MNYVFCGAYRHLFFALYLKKIGSDIKIVTYNNDIKNFCDYSKIDCIYFDSLTLDLESFYKIKSLKKRLDKIIDEIKFNKNDNFYVLSNVFGYQKFYLATKFAKVGKVYYKNSEREFKKYRFDIGDLFKKNILKHFLFWGKFFMKYLFKIALCLDIVFFEINESPVYGFDEKFFKKHNIRKIIPEKNYDELISEVVKNSNILKRKYDNIIIDDGSTKDIIKYDSISKIYTKILDLSIDLSFKNHPGQTNINRSGDFFSKKKFKDIEKLPSYIPIELLFNNIKRNAISIFSVSLISAARIKHLKAVSLLELVDWKNKSYKKEMKNYLKKASKNKIFFPESINELKEIIMK